MVSKYKYIITYRDVYLYILLICNKCIGYMCMLITPLTDNLLLLRLVFILNTYFIHQCVLGISDKFERTVLWFSQ